ncbi:hypothetical protein [Bartonella sp. AP28SXKL]|uniref:hypothetical protein n=1 Tax=Bartonella sp. AP28SXKL TaxID=3243484 RepID=UPI0035CF74B0
MNKHQGSRRTVWLNGGTQSLKIQDETLACFISIARFREFLLCLGAMSTKSKKLTELSVFDSRNTNARALATGRGA